jgi:hypothetical protein
VSDRASIPVALDRAFALRSGSTAGWSTSAAGRPLASRRAFDAATDLLDTF